MWFVIQVGGRGAGNVSTQKECIVKPPILYTREFTQEKATMNFLQLEPEFVPIRQDLYQL